LKAADLKQQILSSVLWHDPERPLRTKTGSVLGMKREAPTVMGPRSYGLRLTIPEINQPSGNPGGK
jgi:hypothetical protein